MPLKPGSIIKTDDFLAVNEYIRSDNGLFFACMQDDGNFCVYRGQDPHHPYADLWCSFKLEAGKKFIAFMQSDANFVVCKGTSARDRQPPFWSSQKNLQPPGGKYFAWMQDDGNFCVYKGTGPRDKTGGALWCSDTMDRPKPPVLDSKSIIKYDMAAAKTQTEGELDLYHQTVKNGSSVEQTSEISGEATVTEEFGFSNSLGISVAVATEFKCGFPALAEGKVGVTVTGSYEHTWSRSESRSKTWSFSTPLVVPPGTTMAVDVKATKSEIEVPYSTDVLVEYESGTKLRVPMEGIYSGSSTHSLMVTFRQVSPVPLGKVKPVTKKIENATAEYS
ncbi:MAG: ETX/MTX2 family pore-forming toxin [Geminicoccaceae bacterium]